jgi:osmotically-inducible protein OsmY
VTAFDGTAHLYGTVDNYFEKALADDVAAVVDGVAIVENALQVRSTDWVGYDPFLDGPYLYGFDWYDYTPPRTWAPDAQIADDIESQLWWSPFVDSADVSVEVDDGVATLTGSVGSWSEYEAARENAYQGGAVWVDNNLTIEAP